MERGVQDIVIVGLNLPSVLAGVETEWVLARHGELQGIEKSSSGRLFATVTIRA